MEEHQLIKKCIQRDSSAQQLFYEQYLAYLLTIIRRYGCKQHEEPDYVQEIFVELFLCLDKFQADKGSLTTWVRTIAVRKIMKIKRKDQTIQTIAYEELSDSESPFNYQSVSTAYLFKAISKLPAGYREVFNLYEVDGYSHKEISDFLKISASASRSQLTRAKKLLQQIISKLQMNMAL